jgi:hypothetical protein
LYQASHYIANLLTVAESCLRRKLTCEYQLHDPQPRNEKQSILPAVYTQSIPSEPVVAEASLYRHVIQLIHESGHFVDDLSTHYFQGMHRYLPVCSRPHFYSNLITLGAIPPAGFSVLLLTICLTASATHADRLTLRSTVNYLVTLVQEFFPVSIPLIQSRILLAIYDYTNGRPEDAFQAIAGCARMAYTARLHRHFLPACQSDAEIQANSDAPEEANTWWGIIICER